MKTNPDFMWDFYTTKPIPYDLRNGEKLYLPTANTTCYERNFLIFRGSFADLKNNQRHFRKNHSNNCR